MPESTRAQLDYSECRARLAAITNDVAILDSFDRLAACAAAGDDESGVDLKRMILAENALDEFLRNDMRLNISLDYVFGGRGEPFMPPLVVD